MMMPWAATAPAPFSVPEQDAKLAAWLDARAGKLTASRMKDAMSFLKNGEPSIKRSDYMRELLAERLTGYTTRHFVTAAMQWGLDTEAEAKLVYAKIAGVKLLPADFVEHPTIENFGATPDSFIAHDGLLECKCPTTGTFIEWKLAGVVPEEHKPQMIVQCAVTKRPYCDFFSYDPRIKEESKRYFLRRFEPTQTEIMIVEEHASRFLDELDELFSRFVEAA
jgi:predicted phage-related endonuclease